MSNPVTAFKVLTADQMAALEDDEFEGAPVDIADGYIHLSTAEQLEGTIAKYFADCRPLMIAEVDLLLLGDAVRWEPARGGELFPHIYAELPIHAVVSLQRRD